MNIFLTICRLLLVLYALCGCHSGAQINNTEAVKQNIIIVGSNSSIISSNNNGASWHLESTPTINSDLLAIARHNNHLVVVGFSGTILNYQLIASFIAVNPAKICKYDFLALY